MNPFFVYARLLSFLLVWSTVVTCIHGNDSVASTPMTKTAVCLGTSLLQASSNRIAAHSTLLQKSTAVAGWHLILGAVVVLLVAVVLKMFFPSLPGSRPGTQSADSADSSDSFHTAESADVQGDESDDGDWDLSKSIPFSHFVDSKSLNQKHNFEERIEYDPDAVKNTIDDSFSSWNLFFAVLGALFKFWAALGFMYWSLLYREEELMNCNAYPREKPHSWLVRHSCSYTLACLHGFPMLAANMVLVLMVRILLQRRIYYSMLRRGFVLDFASLPVMRTVWPWACGFSMLQGMLHFVLKIFFDLDKFADVSHEENMLVMLLVRKFALPGAIFFAFLLRYGDIENVLVPLNRIVEQEYTRDARTSPWLAKIEVMNERVYAWDARHRDVVGATQTQVGKAPTIDDIVQNIVHNYDHAHKLWQSRAHVRWGLFKSFWPASVILDRRLDWRHDPDTRAWVTVFTILASGCILASMCSLYFLFASTSTQLWRGTLAIIQSIYSGKHDAAAIDTETTLANFAMSFHGILVVLFISRTFKNMYHFKLSSDWRMGDLCRL